MIKMYYYKVILYNDPIFRTALGFSDVEELRKWYRIVDRSASVDHGKLYVTLHDVTFKEQSSFKQDYLEYMYVFLDHKFIGELIKPYLE